MIEFEICNLAQTSFTNGVTTTSDLEEFLPNSLFPSLSLPLSSSLSLSLEFSAFRTWLGGFFISTLGFHKINDGSFEALIEHLSFFNTTITMTVVRIFFSFFFTRLSLLSLSVYSCIYVFCNICVRWIGLFARVTCRLPS